MVPLAPGQVGQPAADRLAGELGGDPVAVCGLPRGRQVGASADQRPTTVGKFLSLKPGPFFLAGQRSPSTARAATRPRARDVGATRAASLLPPGSEKVSGMPEVDFERLSPDQYEDMVAVLLSRIRQTHRVDGSGSDGGRDCYFTDADGTEAYELKSFTGRMNAARRRQVKRSLTRGLRSSPRSWSLVVPIDATPAEQRWFDSLGSGTTTKLTWLGRTWLQDQLAAHPDIGRYFAGAAEEVVQILTDIAREDALPADAAGVAGRMTAMVARLNEIDPYYRFEYGVSEDRVTVFCQQRYPDAVRDRPITVSAQLHIDDSTTPELRAAIDDFMRYGSPVQIPAENISHLTVDGPGGLDTHFDGGDIALDGAADPAAVAEARNLVLRIPPTPPTRQALIMHITRRSRGPAGGFRLEAADAAGLLTLDMRLDPATST